ncbi:TPA: hypothetical protein SCM97_002810 [Yersinia enterocolitica]|nr:hypothetical protein [Yersinia enterocolitica]HDM9013939.1 hypothetical protein [Yersinia enterocolitica]HEG1275436.1 hypothetical protein [Yersinia enterocolitica]
MKELDSFTVERLGEIKNAFLDCNKETAPNIGEIFALIDIALAAKRAEPVAWVVGDEEIADFKNGREVCVMRDCDDEKLDYLPLYTTPQFNSPDIPEGWKLVPIEITKTMRDAWDSAPNCHEDDDVNMCNAYRAMIAAAPEKPL